VKQEYFCQKRTGSLDSHQVVTRMEKKRTTTIQSFDFQWHNLTDGPHLLSDRNWRENVPEYIVDELQISRRDISGKSVLDCGCGNGRWSYGFEKLGCSVHGFDTSLNGIEYAREHVAGRFDIANILDKKNLLSLYKENSFDIVWCLGGLASYRGSEESLWQHRTLREAWRNSSCLRVRQERVREQSAEVCFQPL